MQHSLDFSLDRIIRDRDLTVLFQPIIANTQRTVFGYEALIRGPANSPLHSPVILFESAVRYGRLPELELLCREVSIQQFKRLNLPGKLFLNIIPDSLLQPAFRSDCILGILQRTGMRPEQVVIELTEHYPMEDYEVVREARRHCKEMGIEMAIDDLGAGYAGLRMWSELRPDYVKIDRHFMEDIHQDAVKQEFVRSIQGIARGLNCRVIGEGVETVEEYQTVAGMGIEFCQGYYFARPAQAPAMVIASSFFAKGQQGAKGHGSGSLQVARCKCSSCDLQLATCHFIAKETHPLRAGS